MIFNVAPRLLSAASKFVGGSEETTDEARDVRDSLLKRSLGLADSGIPIGRETEPAHYVRWQAEGSEASNTGGAAGEEGKESLVWREYLSAPGIWSAGASTTTGSSVSRHVWPT